MNKKDILSGTLIIWLATVTCNLPAAMPQITPTANAAPTQDIAATAAAMALTLQANALPSPTSTTEVVQAPQPTATQCSPMITANTNANVRSGPGTAYDIIGYIPAGGTARVTGRNDANSWWYIEFGGGAGNHAWVAGSVTTSACVPAVLQVVAAPSLPTAVPATETSVAPVNAMADLIVSEFTITPATPVMGQPAHVRIGVYNQGDAASGHYVVYWYGLSTFSSPTCQWSVNKSNAHGGRILECDYAFPSWYPVNKTSLAIVDASNQVDESDEGNNQGTISPFGVAKP